jgi:hypothetical protein
VQDVSVLSEHVDLLNTRDGLHVQLLERALQLFVVLSRGWLGFPDDFPSDGSLPTCTSNPTMATNV